MNLFVGVIVVTVAVVIGFVLFEIPGFFLPVSLYFWGLFVIVEDENFIEGLQHSWSLTKGNRITLFGLGAIVFVIVLVVNVVFSIPSFFLPDLLGGVVNAIATAFMSILFAATGAQAFRQLREGAVQAETASELATPDNRTGVQSSACGSVEGDRRSAHALAPCPG